MLAFTMRDNNNTNRGTNVGQCRRHYFELLPETLRADSRARTFCQPVLRLDNGERPEQAKALIAG